MSCQEIVTVDMQNADPSHVLRRFYCIDVFTNNGNGIKSKKKIGFFEQSLAADDDDQNLQLDDYEITFSMKLIG